MEYDTHFPLGDSEIERQIALTTFKFSLTGTLWRTETKLKSLPVSADDCYGTCSYKRGCHDHKENTVRASANWNCQERCPAATQAIQKFRMRAPGITESTSEARGRQALIEEPFADYFQEDHMTSMMERNLPRQGESANPERFSRRKMVWTKTPRMEAWTCCACGWAFRPSGPPVGDSLEEMMLNYELQRDAEYASHVCAMCPKTRSARIACTFSKQADNRI